MLNGKPPAHSITLEPWGSTSLGTRVAIEAAAAVLWALKPDDRMTALISLLAAQIATIAENEDQIDAIVDVLRMQLKLIKLQGH